MPALNKQPATLVDFERPEEGAWQIVNDGVMGGVSHAAMAFEGGLGVFAGTVSPENNGGFASVRRAVEQRIPMATALVLRARGDGKRYQLRLRTDNSSDAVSYSFGFVTAKDQWQTVTAPLADFRATFRGREVAAAPALEAKRIRQLGLLISDGQFGTFRIEIASIEATNGTL